MQKPFDYFIPDNYLKFFIGKIIYFVWRCIKSIDCKMFFVMISNLRIRQTKPT